MIYTAKISKLGIYVNDGKKHKTIDDVKLETGADAVFNGGMYNLSTFKPVMHLKASGKVYAKDVYTYEGLAWNDDDPTMHDVLSNNIDDYDNFICYAMLIGSGNKLTLNVQDPNTKRGRTAIGMKKDGTFVALCVQDGKESMTPKQVRDAMYEEGCYYALLLDGGSSSHCITPKGSLPASANRPYVQNYITVWEAKEDNDDKEDTEDNKPTETKKYLYRVQTGAFKLKFNATRLKDELVKKGYSAFVTYVAPYYKVQVGAFSLITNAEKMRNRLNADGYSSFITKTEVE